MSLDGHGLPRSPHPLRIQFKAAATLCTKRKPVIHGGRSLVIHKSYAQVATSVKQQAVKPKSCGLKPNKSKPSYIGIRLSQNEREKVVKQAESSRLTVSEYVRASILGAGYISTIDPVKRQLLQDVNRELCRQGNNLNQIAKHLNANIASPDQAESMLAILARSLLAAHRVVRQALTEGRGIE